MSPLMLSKDIPISPTVDTVFTTSGQTHFSEISRQNSPISTPPQSHVGEPKMTGVIGLMFNAMDPPVIESNE